MCRASRWFPCLVGVLVMLVFGGCGGGDSTTTPPAVATVVVSPGATTIEVGATAQLAATPRDANGNPLNDPVTWSSDASSIASISSAGLVSGVAPGSAMVMATAGGKTGTANIQVIPRAVAVVVTTLPVSELEVGLTTNATVVVRDAQGNVLTDRPVAYSTGNPAIASVSAAGVVTALAVGSTTVVATSEGKSGSATLTIIPAAVASVTVALAADTVEAGASTAASAALKDRLGNVLTDRVVAWSSGNPAIASVAQNGVVTAVAVGSTTITATSEGKSGGAPVTVVAAVGTVTGVVTAADGTTPIPDAIVELQTSGSVWSTGGASRSVGQPSLSTRTALDGSYTLANVPTGVQVLIARRGNFVATINVTVFARKTTTAPKAKLVSTGRLAYVSGDFDTIEHIVGTVLGNPIEMIEASALGSSAVTSQYRMIFLNCGLDEGPAVNAAVIANLRAFLQAGGTIYASDWAAVYVKELFSGFTFDRVGDEQSTTATVVDASLQAFLGKTTVSIVYDLGGWADLLSIPGTARVLLRGSYTAYSVQRTDQPLAVVIPYGQGRVVYTTFHNEAGATPDQLAVLRHFIYLP